MVGAKFFVAIKAKTLFSTGNSFLWAQPTKLDFGWGGEKWGCGSVGGCGRRRCSMFTPITAMAVLNLVSWSFARAMA